MAWDPVPAFVGGGAVHSVEVGRLSIFLSSGGQEGVLNPLDHRVLALATPGGSVRVQPGACVIRNRSINSDNQSYAARMAVEDVVAVAPTTSTGPRSDLLIALVQDPNPAGSPWAAPTSIPNGPYIVSYIVQNVPPTTTTVRSLPSPYNGYSAITLARIDIPINTAAITQTMIKDMRTVSNPVTGSQPPPGGGGDGGPSVPPVTPPAGGGGGGTGATGGGGTTGDGPRSLIALVSAAVGDLLQSTHTVFRDWPVASGFNYAIPSWATHCDVQAVLHGVRIEVGNLTGQAALVIAGAQQFAQKFDVSRPGADVRQSLTLAQRDMPIPAALRGTNATWKLQGMVTAGTGQLRADDATTVSFQISFKSKPS